MTSQPGKQTVAIHILPNVSRNKCNQTMKFRQLIECNMRNIFLPYTKCGGETSLRPFSKKTKLNISLDQYYKVSYSSYILYTKLKGIEIS